MIRFLLRGVLWVVLGWSVGAAVGAWALGNRLDLFFYAALSTGVVNTLWMERRLTARRRRELP